MKQNSVANWIKKGLVITAFASLAACSTLGELADVGKAPSMSPIKDVKAPATEQSLSYNRPDLSPKARKRGTSLWREGASSFHQDQRARHVGDLLRVQIAINDNASLGNSTTRSRASDESVGVPNFLGLEAAVPFLIGGTNELSNGQSAIRNAYNPSSLVSGTSSGSYTGNGAVQRSESVNALVSAMVSQVLPNGNLVIEARQETVVNFERRDLIMTGIIRPQDVSADNTIQHSQIAQMRLFYGGRGQLTNVQQPRKGQQIFDILFPF